jgi:hypothetical protein
MQAFPVTGTNLSGAITVTAPTGFEVSSNFIRFGQTAKFAPVNGTVDGFIYLRLARTAQAGANYDNLSVAVSSPGAITRYVYTAASGNIVNKIQQIIYSYASTVIKTLDSGSYNLSAKASSGLPVTFSSSDPAVATVVGSTVTLNGFGTTTITATQAGDSNFFPAQDKFQTLIVVTPLQQWRLDTFGTLDNTGSTADEADFDGDGLANILEFGFGTDPTQPQRGSLSLTDSTSIVVGEPVTVVQQSPIGYFGQFIRRADHTSIGIVYVAEFSDDLIHWESSSTGLSVIATDDGYEIVEIPFPATLSTGNPPRFFRVRVMTPPM